MKKLLLFALLLTCINISAQESFTRKYTKMIPRKNYVQQPTEDVELLVVFNPGKNKIVKFYYSNGKIKTFNQFGDVETGSTDDGTEYQLIYAIDSDDGYQVGIQLFDDRGVLRLLVAHGYDIEFYE
jgi:hypothetical protein